MAEEQSLREVNLILLSRLHVAQKAIWKDVKSMKRAEKTSEMHRPLGSSVFEGFGPDRTPITLQSRRKALSELSTRITPRKQAEKGSLRFCTPTRGIQKENRPLVDKKKGLNSILKTPESQMKRQIESGERRQHVTFQPSTASVKKSDQSFLGYDWIAGMLDNDSYISQKDDSFFNELKEFRRVNRTECTGTSFLQNTTKSPMKEINTPQRCEEEKYHKCSDTYVLDDRLFAVPIHGSDSYCSLCKTRKPAEYENQDSYVRISVPRSTLQSPHRVKPHRRKSFDPTDSVSLSKHCLLGWQSSKPAVIPSHSAMDLRAHTGISKLAQQYPSMSMITVQNVSGKSSIVQFRYFTDSNAFTQGANTPPPKSTHNM